MRIAYLEPLAWAARWADDLEGPTQGLDPPLDWRPDHQ